MKTRTYEGVQHGDWVRCVLCGAQMLLPCGADKCPECSSELIEVFKKGITVKLKYVEKRVLDAFTDNGIDLSNYTHCIIVKRNFYLAW